MRDSIATVTSPAPTPWNFIPEESYITPHPSGISYFLFSSVVGYGYFLEPHIIADTFLMCFEGNISNVHIARLINVISTKIIFLYA